MQSTLPMLPPIALFLTLLAIPPVAAEVDSVDQIFDATGGGGSVAISSVSSLAQTFTADVGGLLTRVAMQISRSEDAEGQFSLVILPTTAAGQPDGSGGFLFSHTYPVADIPAEGAFQYTYMEFDIASAEIRVSPGDTLAIALVHAGNYPDWLFWDTNTLNGYPGGSGFVEHSGGTQQWELLSSPRQTWDLGFKTYVAGFPSEYGLRIPLIKAAIDRRSKGD